MKVIALTGRAGSGKDTAAQLLQYMMDSTTESETLVEEITASFKNDIFSTYNDVSEYQIHKFAWPVYQMVGILLNRDPEEIMLDRTFKDTIQYKKMTGRELLQKVGTECFRDVLGTDVWIDIMHRHLTFLDAKGVAGVIISDLRFIDEGTFLTDQWDALIIKMVGRSSEVSTSHQSEAEIDKIKARHYVHNVGTITDLAENLNCLSIVEQIITTKYNWI